MGLELYIIIFALLLLLHYATTSTLCTKDSSRVQAIGCFLILFILYCFRDLSVLNDTIMYFRHQQDIVKNGPDFIEPFAPKNPNNRFEYFYIVFDS